LKEKTNKHNVDCETTQKERKKRANETDREKETETEIEEGKKETTTMKHYFAGYSHSS
jgi:hypothetical protein